MQVVEISQSIGLTQIVRSRLKSERVPMSKVIPIWLDVGSWETMQNCDENLVKKV